MNKWLPQLVFWMVKLLKVTCRIRAINDQRPALRAAGQPYIYATLHAQQLAVVVYGEPGTGAIVSRSKDGDLIARSLEKTGVVPIRGSSGTRKGGATALRAMVNHVASGKPVCVMVDGPKGPRGTVNPGVAMLSQKTGAPVIPLLMVPNRRKVFASTWDRTQIPFPFSTIVGAFGDPMFPVEGESVKQFTARIQAKLAELECEHDPDEAAVTEQSVEPTSAPARAA